MLRTQVETCLREHQPGRGHQAATDGPSQESTREPHRFAVLNHLLSRIPLLTREECVALLGHLAALQAALAARLLTLPPPSPPLVVAPREEAASLAGTLPPQAGGGRQAPAPAHTLLTTKEAAVYLNMSASTLEKWRMTGEGPTYLQPGRKVRYRQKDLDTWLATRER
jgi:excisionase family DNA binding protein